MSEEKALSGTWWNCPDCGYRNEEGEYRCEKCGRRFVSSQPRIAPQHSHLAGNHKPPPVSSEHAPFQRSGTGNGQQSAEGSRWRGPQKTAGAARRDASLQKHLRQQLSVRVQDFRSRQLNPTLPLEFGEAKYPQNKVIPFGPNSGRAARAPGASAVGGKPRRSRPLSGQQPGLNFPSPSPQSENFSLPAVAPFRLRMLGHGIDLALSLAALLVFLATLKLVVGSLVLDRYLLAGSLCAYLLLALFYGAVFLCLAGATPAMRWMGLRLVNFDGMPAARRQLLWRLLGAIVSAGSFFLGFLWAAVDEERLSWHDRISKTFLTTARP